MQEKTNLGGASNLKIVHRPLTKKEAAEYLSVCESTIDNLVRRGELTKYKLGSSVRFKIDDLNETLKKF